MLTKLLNKRRCQSHTVMCETQHIANKYDNWLKCVTDCWLCQTISKHIKYKSDTHYDNVCLHNCLCVNIGSMYFSRFPKLQHVCLSAVCNCVISVCLSVSLSLSFSLCVSGLTTAGWMHSVLVGVSLSWSSLSPACHSQTPSPAHPTHTHTQSNNYCHFVLINYYYYKQISL